MGRPKKTTLEDQIAEEELREQNIIRDIKKLQLETPRGKYIRDIILIVHTLNKPIDDISDEIMIFFGELMKEVTNVRDT